MGSAQNRSVRQILGVITSFMPGTRTLKGRTMKLLPVLQFVGDTASVQVTPFFPRCKGPPSTLPPGASQQLWEASRTGSSPHFLRSGKRLALRDWQNREVASFSQMWKESWQCSETRLLGPAWVAVLFRELLRDEEDVSLGSSERC